VAVAGWENGEVDGFNTAGENWAYSVRSSCGTSLTARTLALSSAAENLGSESEETATFATYERFTYLDASPPSSGTATLASTCELNYGIYYMNNLVGNVTTLATSNKILTFDQMCSKRKASSSSSSSRSSTQYDESNDIRYGMQGCSNRDKKGALSSINTYTEAVTEASRWS
jgi:hypothetical protein